MPHTTHSKSFKTPQTHTTEKINRWRSKELHGRHLHDLEQPHIDIDASNKWLKLGSLFPETEGFMIAIQDQNDKCRKCHRAAETIQHITSACPNLAQTDYTLRHNQVARIIHQKLAIKCNLLPPKVEPYYQYSPKPVLENQSHKIYYDRAILTDKTIHYNRPDITMIDKQKKHTYIIDIAVPNTHNLQKTITEKIHKYTDLKEEIIRIWKMEKVSGPIKI
uniref:SFRICE_006526 n=1 Tax=Spodoptera frugiperda TaxID=7108 RepID=A0A2H1VMW0_SPOFR